MEDKEYFVYIRRHSGSSGSVLNLGPFPANWHQLNNLQTGVMARNISHRSGVLHRSGGLPAVIGKKGTREWWVNGGRHRDGDLPAVIDKDGTLEWWVNGEQHRDGDRPAIIKADGGREWWVRDENDGVQLATNFLERCLRHVFVTAILW